MTIGVGWACRLKTGVATVVEEMKEVVVSTEEKVADEAAGAVKAIEEGGSERKAWRF